MTPEFDSMPQAPFVLRFDFRATERGVRGGLPSQSTSWEALIAATWEEAKQEARKRVSSIPASRWSGDHYLQGIVLVEKTEEPPFRMVSFRRNEVFTL